MSMIIDGKHIAEKIQKQVASDIALLAHGLVLAVVVVGDDPVTERFIAIKRKFAEETGIHIEEHHFGDTIDTDTLLAKVEDLALDDSVHGIVVQLPLPKDIDRASILGAIPLNKDVDLLSQSAGALFSAGKSPILPPVVGACKEVLQDSDIDLHGKKIVVVGKGHLVGGPVATWFKNQGLDVTIVNQSENDIFQEVQSADILVLGAGSPGIVKLDMIKDGVVVLDAGTSEAGGKLAGDAERECAEKCSVFTPVPGGIGPITVAMIFKNLMTLHG